MKEASAKAVLDSISPDGVRLITMEVTMWRPMLAEFNTHRAFSRNAASSRAIPVETQIQRILDNPALPIRWGSNKKGMQAGEELEGEVLEQVKSLWLQSLASQVDFARELKKLGLHKQWTNRLIEPYMWLTDIVSFTDIDNFFWQRCSELASPEFKAPADAMQEVYYTSKPVKRDYGEWHLPYIKNEDWADISLYKPITMSELEYAKAVSTARCARVSYLQHDGTRNITKDYEMYRDTLKAHLHPSPFEHIATPCPKFQSIKYWNDLYSQDNDDLKMICKRWGNFFGWDQHRKELENENRTNFKPNLPHLIGENNES